MSLYVGNKAQAHDIAMEIINAKGADSNALVKLSGLADFSLGYNALPTECLFYLSKYDVNTYVNALLIGGNNRQVSANNYYVTLDRLNELYESIPGATASHNRYLNTWNRTAKNTSSKTTPTLTKYWYDNSQYGSSSSNSGILSTKLQIIPMLRLSEMYLIAMETSNSLDEVHALYDTYMYSCSFTLYTPFASLDEARTEIVNEYRREFFGEGQMFYTYKRLGIDHMKWNSDLVGDDCYVLPLPASEYDPAIGQ